MSLRRHSTQKDALPSLILRAAKRSSRRARRSLRRRRDVLSKYRDALPCTLPEHLVPSRVIVMRRDARLAPEEGQGGQVSGHVEITLAAQAGDGANGRNPRDSGGAVARSRRG